MASTLDAVTHDPDTWPQVLDDARPRTLAIQERENALPSYKDIPNTTRAQEEYWRVRNTLMRSAGNARTAAAQIKKWGPTLAPMNEWREHLTTWRGEFVPRLLALPNDARERTPDEEKQRIALTRAIAEIDRGCAYSGTTAHLSPLLAERIKSAYTPTWEGSRDPWDYGFGSLVATEERIALARAHIVEAFKKLDDALRMGEAAQFTV